MGTKTNILMDKEKMELISEYATAAIFLYGVISLEEFVDVFNFYEQADITATEVGPALHEMAKNDDVEYSFYNNILSEPELQPGFHNYEHNVSSVRYSQKGKPHYLPKKSEFLRYVDWEYREPKAPYVKLEKYILKHKLKNRDGKPGDIEEDLIELHWMIRFGIDTKNCMDYFTRTGYEFNSIDEAKEFMQLVIVANNNTRIY